jgi:two-component sensor histidine kinase/HAMP domain-containing protein
MKRVLVTNRLPLCIPGGANLRCRLLMLLGATLLVMLLVIGLTVFNFISRSEQRAWQGRQSEAARYAAETVRVFINHATENLMIAAGIPKDDPLAEFHIKDLLRQNQTFLEIIRLDSTGNVFVGAHTDAPLLANLFTIPQSRWFQLGREGQTFLGNVQISPESEPYLIMSVPAPDGGVVAARLRMLVLWDVVAGLRFGEKGQAYVINSEGKIVAHTNHTVPLAAASLAGRPEMAAVLAAPGHHWNGAYTNFQGANVVGVSAAVPGTPWIVITELSKTEAFATSNTALILLGGGMLLSGLGAMVLTGRFLGQVVLRPMDILRAGAERIGHGALDHRIEIYSKDEIGQVAAAFNQMAHHLSRRDTELAGRAAVLVAEISERMRAEESLREARDELEIRVQSRTAELARANNTLQQEIRERQRIEEEITESLREKEVLLKEIHHRVKNNLQVVSSLLRLQSAAIDDPQVLDVFNDSQNRIRSMALIHEKLYRSKNLAQVDFAEYARDLVTHLIRTQRSQGRSHMVEFNTTPIHLDIDKAVPCGLIINELVSNSLKHAFPNGKEGIVRLTVQTSDTGHILLGVSDNGIGFPAHLDFQTTASLGLQLVNTLVDQFDGNIEMIITEGTEFKITFDQ